MRVLIGCEYSGTVREAFAARGHYALSCDLLPTDRPGNHYQGDIRDVLDQDWDLGIFHPPCTFMTTSGARWFHHPDDKHLPVGKRRPHPAYPNRRADQEAALEFVGQLLNAKINHIALENPVGVISSRIRKPDQIIQPHQFGHDASKNTCLWLKNLPKLIPTKHIAPRVLPNGAKRWANQVDASGANNLPPSADRWEIRSTTYAGVADAMADQWGSYLELL